MQILTFLEADMQAAIVGRMIHSAPEVKISLQIPPHEPAILLLQYLIEVNSFASGVSVVFKFPSVKVTLESVVVS